MKQLKQTNFRKGATEYENISSPETSQDNTRIVSVSIDKYGKFQYTTDGTNYVEIDAPSNPITSVATIYEDVSELPDAQISGTILPAYTNTALPVKLYKYESDEWNEVGIVNEYSLYFVTEDEMIYIFIGTEFVPTIPSNVVTTDGNQTITGLKDFTNGIEINGNKIEKDSNGAINIYYGNTAKVIVGDGETDFANSVVPNANNSYDLGKSANKWKDAYIAGNLTDGTNSIAISDIASATNVDANYVSVNAQTFTSGQQTQARTNIDAEQSFSKNSAFNKSFETDTTNIKMAGVVSVGSATTVARADHVHPSDTTKANKSETVSNVSYDGTNKKLQKTINGTTSDVVNLGVVTTSGSESVTVGANTLNFGANAFTSTSIPTQASDIGAMPDSTKYGASLSVSGTSVSLKDQDGAVLSTITTQDTTYESKTASQGGTDVSLVTTGEKYTWNNKQSALSSSQMEAVNSGATTTNIGQIATNTSAISTINEKIPSDASSNNQLADKSFVNSSINALAAYYITSNAGGDPFATKLALTNATTFYSGGVARVPTTNDYCIVLADESKQSSTGVDPTTRYTYQGGTYPNGQWEYQYTINDTPLTSAQLNAINSGITSSLVTQIGTNQSDISSLSSNKQDKIDSSHKLSADLVDDTSTTNKFVTASDKTTWDGKQNALPTTSTAGKVLKSTSTAGTVEWGDDNNTNTWRPVKVDGVEKLTNSTSGNSLDLVGGSNVTLTESSGAVTISATDTTYSSLSAANGGTDVSLVTTGEKYIWNNKQDALVSGTNIKTINNESILGSGNISISSGGTATDVQINGTSITSGGVADIKTNGTYNETSNKIATMNDLPASITITTTSGSESISDGTNTLSFGANAFNNTTIPTSYVSSVNGSTGAITNVAKTNATQTFSAEQTFTANIKNTGTYYIGSANGVLASMSGSTLTLGNSSSALAFAGSGTRPTYNNNSLALVNDLPTATTLTTTSGSEAITVGNDTINVVTRDTAQTISGDKVFSGTNNFTGDFLLNGSLLTDILYPVGSIYISTVDVNPMNFIGGSWTKLPAGYALWTASSGAYNGTTGTIAAGLPNIKGTYTQLRADSNAGFDCDGVLFKNSISTSSGTGTGAGGKRGTITFNANAYNSIYKDSATTVQPPAIKIYAWRRINSTPEGNYESSNGSYELTYSSGTLTVSSFGYYIQNPSLWSLTSSSPLTYEQSSPDQSRPDDVYRLTFNSTSGNWEAYLSGDNGSTWDLQAILTLQP